MEAEAVDVKAEAVDVKAESVRVSNCLNTRVWDL